MGSAGAASQSSVARQARGRGNIGVLLVDVVVFRVLAPGAAVAVAIIAETGGWGLINFLSLPSWIAIPAGVDLLDLAIYFQHVMFHAVPTLWRLHRVHHADLEFDVTTGTRFHPFEIILSTAIKCASSCGDRGSAVSVLIFEVLLNAAAMFNHANASLPGPARPMGAMDRGNARYAPGSPLRPLRGVLKQFRLQFSVVGSPLRDLSRSAEAWS